MTFVHCGPRASGSACVRSPPAASSRASCSTSRIGAGRGSNGPNQESPWASYRTTPGATTAPAVTMLPRMTRGTSSAMTSSLPSPFCRLTTEAFARAARAPSTAARVCSDLVATRPKSHAGRSRPSVLARTGAAKSASPVTRSPPRLHRGHVLGPGVDGPHLDAGHAGQVRGVQAPDRAAADDRDADARRRRAASARHRSLPTGSGPVTTPPARFARYPRRPQGRRRRRRGRPPRARRRGPAGRRGRRAPAAPRAPRAPRRPQPSRTGLPSSPLSPAEQRRGARHRLRHRHPAGRGAVHQVLLDRVTAAVHHGHRHPDPAARGRVHRRVAERPGPVQLGLAGGRGSGGHAQAVGRVDVQVAEALLPALAVVPVLAGVRQPERVGDQQVLGVGRPAVRAERARVDVGREERAHRRARGRDAGHDHAAGADRHPARAGEQRLRRRLGEPGRDRRGDRRHPVQVLGARDLLGGRDPGLRPGPGHTARAARRPSGTP